MLHAQRIVTDTGIRFGKPCVRGTRITVSEVLDFLACGGCEAEICAEFPQLTQEDVRACREFELQRRRRVRDGRRQQRRAVE
jgi:uncharacterized protein (DUF433 family)